MRRFGTGSPLCVTVPSIGTISGPPLPHPAAKTKIINAAPRTRLIMGVSICAGLSARGFTAGAGHCGQIDVQKIDVVGHPGHAAVSISHLYPTGMHTGRSARVELSVVR